MSLFDKPSILAAGIRNRMARAVVNHKPNRWAELQERLYILHRWMLEAEQAGRKCAK